MAGILCQRVVLSGVSRAFVAVVLSAVQILGSSVLLLCSPVSCKGDIKF